VKRVRWFGWSRGRRQKAAPPLLGEEIGCGVVVRKRWKGLIKMGKMIYY
jgi:hypothetical protein